MTNHPKIRFANSLEQDALPVIKAEKY